MTNKSGKQLAIESDILLFRNIAFIALGFIFLTFMYSLHYMKEIDFVQLVAGLVYIAVLEVVFIFSVNRLFKKIKKLKDL